MKITVLGNNGPFPAAGGACSGYLIQDKGKNLLLDCGNGVLGNLQKFIRIEELDAIILSHLHSDHMSDLMVLRYAVQIKNDRGLMNKLIDVFSPSEPADEYARLGVKNAFNLRSVTGELALSFGDMKVTFCEMTHPVKSYAISIRTSQKKFVYSGDTSWNDNIVSFAREADLLMLDSGLLSKDKTDENVAHLTAKECGIIAEKSGSKKLLLTHLWPEYNVSQLLNEAKENFENVETAELLASYEI
jgi:ribonuclease BN (tRNA processing enzyme)